MEALKLPVALHGVRGAPPQAMGAVPSVLDGRIEGHT